MKDFKYSILSIFSGVIANSLTVYIQGTKYMDWDLLILILYVIFILAIGIYAFLDHRRATKDGSISRIKDLSSILYKYASNPDQLFAITPEGKIVIGGHAGNYTWKELAGYVCSNMGLRHLRYSNLGSQYHLVDMVNGESFKIPTDNKIEEPVEKSGLKNGQILLIEKIT